jgi:uncharacterized protein YggT (Ycf19 family)
MKRLVDGIIGIIETGFLLRILLQLFGASASSPFVAWLYGVTNNFARPFLGAFPVFPIGNGAIDFSILLAMICYAILGWLIIQLISFIFHSN